jgi:hypothetical protein
VTEGVVTKKRQKEPLGNTEGVSGSGKRSHKEATEGVTKERQKESLGEIEGVSGSDRRSHCGRDRRSHKTERQK